MKRRAIRFRVALFTMAPGLLLLPGQGLAHGVRGVSKTAEAVCATATYDDGEPMAYGEVEIAAPGAELPFQTGRTDRNGLFCFRPDRVGAWLLVVGDSMGHQVRIQAPVGQDLALTREKVTANAPPMNKMAASVTGLALIFGLGGLLAWWQERRKGKTSTPG